jgi:hypothetical protein
VATEVGRAQVLAHRVRALGLDRAADGLDGLAVLDLGVQDTPPGSADLAVAARLGRAVTRGEDEALVWSWRGSPHLHRRSQLQAVAAAAWPRSDRDALQRMGGGIAGQVEASGTPPLEAFAVAVRTIADVVTSPMAKPEVSTLVTRALPEDLVGWCEPCGVVHVGELLLRSAALPAGLELWTGTGPVTLVPMAGWAPPALDPGATTVALRTYVRLLGPATNADAAAFVGTQTADARGCWPDGLVPVSVDGRDGWFPEEDLDALASAEPVRLVRLLPPGDPYLQDRHRELLLADKAERSQVWRAIGSPGVVVVDGEVAGTWRPKRSGKRLTLTLTPFRTLSAATRRAVEEEAALVAEVRGAASATVVLAD